MGERVNQKNNWSSNTAQQDSVFKLRRFTMKDNNDEELQQSPDINLSTFALPITSPFPNTKVQRQEQNQEEEQQEEKPEVNLKSDSPPTEEPEEEKSENLSSNSIQTKLTIGKPGDKYEQEADATAAKVMGMSDEESEEIHRRSHTILATKPKVLRNSSLRLQAKANKISPSPNLESRLGSSKGGGSPLADDVRGFMEPPFGADFGNVRVHTDSSAVQMNKELGAQAFAHGNDIYYGAGKSPGNNELTAHELTHTIQQTGGLKLNKQIRRQEKEEEEETQAVQAKELPTSANQSNFNKEVQLQAKEEESEETQQETIQPKLITNYSPKASKDVIQAQPLTISSVSPRIQGSLITDKIAGFANNIPGFSLLTLILGKNPITNKPVKRNPTNIIRGVLGLVPGGDSFFTNLQKSGALNKAFTWFQEQIAILNITWSGIKSLFREAYDSIGWRDLGNISGAWKRIKNIFLAPIKRIKNFAIALGKKVMEFVFEGVMSKVGGGGARVMGIIQSAGKHFTNIIKNPIGFVGNLVGAVRGGFSKFSANIGTHLKNGLTGWLFGALGRAGLSVPAKFDLKGIVSIVLQVLNLTKHKLRKMLADKIGEPRVAKLEKTFDFLKTIVTGGLTAAWQKITEFAGNLKETVIGGIRQWVQNSVIKAAIVKLISMFNPAGAVFQAIMAIYNTIQFFIERGSQIAALAQSVFSSIGKIAAGNIGGAAKYVEQTMARTLPVMISFLAPLINLGGIGEQIRNIIKRIRAPIHQALEKLVSFIVSKAKRLFKGKKGKDKNDDKVSKSKHSQLADEAIAELKKIDSKKLGYKSAREKAELKAKYIEKEFTKKLKPKIKLNVHFEEEIKDKKDKDIDFKVIIAPNATKKENSLSYANETTSIYRAPKKGKGEKEFSKGYEPADFSMSGGDDSAYFALKEEAAWEYASHGPYEDFVIEIQIPNAEYEKLHKQELSGRPGVIEIVVKHSEFHILNDSVRKKHTIPPQYR